MKYFSLSIVSFFMVLFFGFGFISAQNEKEIIGTYQDYINAPREVVYLHLNKSTYIKGESIGFTAYVLDKREKKPSLLTTNLYVSIEDKNKTVIKQKLIQVINGVASNVFNVDSLFNSGHYNIKAYTNWMRNFNEPNYYTESIRIIDPETETLIEKPLVDNTIDAQFLPESGHLLNGVLNKVGVVIKDSQGFGVGNAKGEVIDQNNNILTIFTTNQLGIGSFYLTADINTNYTINVKHANKDFNFPLGHVVEKNGIILSVKRLRTKLFASIITNEDTFEKVKSKHHRLMIHNGNGYDAMDVYFTDTLVVNKIIEFNGVPSGINILTLFDENDKPIAERMFFNYEGIDIKKSKKVSATSYGDSLNVKLGFKDLNIDLFHNISVSVLPEETESYNRHNSLLSQTFLQPYMKGYIENGKYYFENIDQKKQFDLDNLLVTQGWSSYDWNNMFLPDEPHYSFEQGIKLKVNINEDNNDSKSTYMAYTNENEEPLFFEIKNTEFKYFYIDGLYPSDYNKIYLSKFEKNNKYQPKLYIQASPNKIPYLNSSHDIPKPKEPYKFRASLKIVKDFKPEPKNLQKLNEVVVKAQLNKEELRIKELKKTVSGRIDIIGDTEIKKYMFLSAYLNSKGFNARDDKRSGKMMISNRSKFKGRPIVYLNGWRADARDLYLLLLNDVDYISIDKESREKDYYGTIRIYSYYGSRREDKRKKQQEFTFPLTFATQKRFYVPKYQFYDDDFYKGYGTIDWKPKLVLDSHGNVEIKIKKPQVPITLFIEGITNDGTFIFEEKSLSLN